MMKDGYSFHVSHEDLDAYYEHIIAAYLRIFHRLGIGDQTYYTFASGGSFSKYSHEFQTLVGSGEDTIYISVEAEKEGKRAAVNKEIWTADMPCPVTHRPTEWRETKASEVANIFKLGTKFSGAFGMDYLDETGARKTPVMGCYGIGISRLMGVITELLADEAGLVWPESIAPAAAHLIVLGKEKTTHETAEKIYSELHRHHDILFDDRDLSAGNKFADSDLIGCPLRIVISDKSLEHGGAEVKKRIKKDAEIVKLENLASLLRN